VADSRLSLNSSVQIEQSTPAFTVVVGRSRRTDLEAGGFPSLFKNIHNQQRTLFSREIKYILQERRKGKERKGKERKGKERKGKERKGSKREGREA